MKIEAAKTQLEELIEGARWPHLLVKKRGVSLTIHSLRDTQKHARMTHLGADQWGLSLPHHTGRWEKTPFQGSLLELWRTLLDNFPFLLDQH